MSTCDLSNGGRGGKSDDCAVTVTYSPDRRLTPELATGMLDCKPHRGNGTDEPTGTGSGFAIASQTDLLERVCGAIEGKRRADIRIGEADIHGDDVVA